MVTERGRPVAELRSLAGEDESLEGRLGRLEATGLVSRPTRRTLSPFRRLRSRGAPASPAVVEDREDRF